MHVILRVTITFISKKKKKRERERERKSGYNFINSYFSFQASTTNLKVMIVWRILERMEN